MKDLEHQILEEKVIELIRQVNETCESVLKNLRAESYIIAAYNIGLLHQSTFELVKELDLDKEEKGNQ